MTPLEKLVNYVAQSPEGDELAAIVYKLAADSAMLKSYKNMGVPRLNKKEKQVFKFTKKGDYINRSFQKILSKGRHTHELRYTFITRAKECGCNLELVMLWDGHKFDEHVKSSAVDRGYTTYSDETYFSEIEKINYDYKRQ